MKSQLEHLAEVAAIAFRPNRERAASLLEVQDGKWRQIARDRHDVQLIASRLNRPNTKGTSRRERRIKSKRAESTPREGVKRKRRGANTAGYRAAGKDTFEGSRMEAETLMALTSDVRRQGRVVNRDERRSSKNRAEEERSGSWRQRKSDAHEGSKATRAGRMHTRPKVKMPHKR